MAVIALSYEVSKPKAAAPIIVSSSSHLGFQPFAGLLSSKLMSPLNVKVWSYISLSKEKTKESRLMRPLVPRFPVEYLHLLGPRLHTTDLEL